MARRPIQRFEGRAQIAQTPDFAVGGGEAMQALAALGNSVSGRLKAMADRAAANEGQMAGLNAGQAAGLGYLERQSAIAAAAPEGEYDLSPHVPAGKEAHLAGIQPQFRGALAALFAAAPDNIRSQLTLNSGYRSAERQSELYAEALAKYGSEAEARKWVAPPGKSRHQHGDAYDLAYGSDAARQWVHANAGKFGLAFPLANEDWHIELASARGGAGHDHAPATGGLNPTPLALRNDNTIYGDAFDAAAIRTYGWRLQQGVSTDIGAAFDQYQDDPAGFANALGEIRDRYSQDENFGDPRVRDLFDRTFAERSETYMRSVAQRHEAKLLAEQASAYSEGYAAQLGDIEKQAYLLGANPEAETILGNQASRLLTQIDHAEAANVITPAEAEAQRTKLDTTLAYARANGVFASLPTPQAQQDFANQLLTDWAKGEGPVTDLGFTQVKALADQLNAQALTAQNRLTAETKAERARIEGLMEADIASIATTGVGLDTAANDLDPARLAALGMDTTAWSEARDRARLGWEATAGMELETPAELNDRLAALAPVPGSPNFVVQSEIFAQALKRRDEILLERQTDPLGQAARAGAIALEPVDPSNPESLALRAQQGKAVAAMYGTPPQYFREEERQQLAAAFYAQPEFLPQFALSVREHFGDDAGRALGELGDAGPELAYVAGIAAAGGDIGVANEVSRVLAGRRDKTISVKMPSEGTMANAGGAVLGGALAANPATRAAVLNVASILFEGQAAAMGFDPSDVDDESSAAFAIWEKSVNRALGARTVNGVQFGGMTQVNGFATVAPPDMPAEELQALVGRITAEDLAALPPIASGNGVAVQPWQVQQARLVAVGNGQYRVALGDPNGFDPQFLQAPDGTHWVLDVSQLREMQAQRPMGGAFNPLQPPVFWRPGGVGQ